MLKGLESASVDLVACVLKLAEDGAWRLGNTRLIRMHSSSRIIGIVTDGNELRLPRLFAEYPISMFLDEYDKDEIVALITKRLEMQSDVVSSYYECFQRIRAYISSLPAMERRLYIRCVALLSKTNFEIAFPRF